VKISRTISRRMVVRGLGGVAIGLPLLESFGGKAGGGHAHAQTAAPLPKRFIMCFEHGGYISAADKDGHKFDGEGAQNGVDAWAPLPGEALQLGATHQPLADHIDSLLVLRGIDNFACKEQSPYNGDHGWANVTALTSANASAVSDEEQTSEGPSIDAVLAERLKAREATPFSSLHLSVPAHNYGTPFFRAAREPSSGEYNPVQVFDKLFAGITTDGDEPNPAAVRARTRRQSILDGVSEGLRLFQNKVSSRDRAAIDAHLTHVRELEQRLADLAIGPACVKPEISPEIDRDWDYYGVQIEKTGPAQVDVLLAALRCGLTNVAGFEIGDFYAPFVNPTFPAAYDIGHSLHHSARDVGKTGPDGGRWQSWYDTMLRNRLWRMDLLKRLLDGLAATPEGDGTMLDNTLLVWTSEFSTGAEHSVSDLPVLIAGKAGGQLRTGRHINYSLRAASDPMTRQYDTEASLHNLYTSVLQLFGFEDAHFGSDHAIKQGPLSGLT
jgi:hypothetical protein